MRKFTLNSGIEVIYTYFGLSIDDAISYFSVIKNLPPEDLLNIFKVIECN